ncbi:MAG: heme-binding domain-containing protein [Draconibacterium sp.]|nr:heme-binding domain-containing protein [Draconibacterium sp.]
MKRLIRVSLILVLVVLVGIQFIPSGTNQNPDVTSDDFVRTFNVPENITALLNVSCYNCHSNNTAYPWYSKVQPIGWLLENHINEGKENLNLSEFGTYSKRKQKSKLKSMISQIEKDEMPMASYTFIHREARLSQDGKRELTSFLNSIRNSLK